MCRSLGFSRRPLLAAGNSNGDLPVLEFTQHPGKPALRLLVRHDDGRREFDYIRTSFRWTT